MSSHLDPFEPGRSPPTEPTQAVSIDAQTLWTVFSNTPGIGISITNAQGQLLFVNEASRVFFSDDKRIDYAGKYIADFHPPEFVEERLSIIAQVIHDGKPRRLSHIYLGRRIESTIWPIRESPHPDDRVIVVTREKTGVDALVVNSDECKTVSTQYIDLGPLAVLTQRELEIMVLLGHGLSVPEAASILHRSPKTVQRHKAAISQKLELHGQADIVAIVTSMGLEMSDAKLKRLR